MTTGNHPSSVTPSSPTENQEFKFELAGSSPHHAQGTETENEVELLAEALSSKFEELSLIHQLSEQLKLSENAGSICQSLLDELAPCIRAQTIAIDLFADEEMDYDAELYSAGSELTADVIRQVGDQTVFQVAQDKPEPWLENQIAIANRPTPANQHQVRCVVVPIRRLGKSLGRMIAIRSLEQEELGTVEADLMKSTSMMLGVHLINQRQYQEMQQMFEGTIQSLVSALDAKDAYTCGHSSRVADLAVDLAQRLGFDEEGVNRIRMAGILHDIGKIGIDDSVLRKPGKLTDEEFEQIKRHPVLGYEILQGIRQFRKILPAVRHHHESWNGSGYPDGLAGKAIPRDAQVLAVADAFDAMSSDRPYRSGMPLEKVVGIFKEGRGIQWAADVVDALLSSPDLLGSDEGNAAAAV
ncbi:MAG: HD-GYP domain-containing protein [Rubripirellula sp.]